MDEFGMKEKKEFFDKKEVLSIPVRAGKRTYFFDVKTTRSNDLYLTITESKRRFNNDEAKFVFEKHKLFLYKEDFEKFSNALNECIKYIEENVQTDNTTNDDSFASNSLSDSSLSDDLSLDSDLDESDDGGVSDDLLGTDFSFEDLDK